MSKRLGRGLDALIPSIEVDENDVILDLDVSRIRVNPYQPRKVFDEGQLAELIESIKEHGVIQPIIVRQSLNGYEIVAGERRWRASKANNLTTIPAIVKSFTDQQVMEISLIENLQREDLNPIEIAYAYNKIVQTFDLTQEELAKRIGVSRPNVANHLRLLKLPAAIIDKVASRELSMGHARALITLEDEEKQLRIAKEVVAQGLSVRELEELLKDNIKDVSRETKVKAKPSYDVLAYQTVTEQLRSLLKTGVRIKPGDKKGIIEIDYINEKDLQRIIDIIWKQQ
jgi:ParB family chromosome partitioning protein